MMGYALKTVAKSLTMNVTAPANTWEKIVQLW